MIQIHGAGVAGSYLYHLLDRNGYDVGIHDIRSSPDCRCAWGIAYKEAKRLYREIGINLDDYILLKPAYIVVNGIWLRNKNVVIFDKKGLLEELWSCMEFGNANAKHTDVELRIDATGAARALLPKIENDRVLPTRQCMEKNRAEENIYIQMDRTGYSWAFPLGNNRWHIGAGNVSMQAIESFIKRLREKHGFEGRRTICSCTGKVRMLQPSKCRPFIAGNVVGVGEAIGCVSGAGEGNVPALESARILFECLDKDELTSYEAKVLSELEWVEMEQAFVDALLNGKVLAALKALPRIVSIERQRSVEHSLRDIRKILGI